jgi:hypothetical protein
MSARTKGRLASTTVARINSDDGRAFRRFVEAGGPPVGDHAAGGRGKEPARGLSQQESANGRSCSFSKCAGVRSIREPRFAAGRRAHARIRVHGSRFAVDRSNVRRSTLLLMPAATGSAPAFVPTLANLGVSRGLGRGRGGRDLRRFHAPEETHDDRDRSHQPAEELLRPELVKCGAHAVGLGSDAKLDPWDGNQVTMIEARPGSVKGQGGPAL